VAEDASLFHGGDVALEEVQIGSADGGGLDLDDRVGRLMDGRLRDVVPGLVARPVIDEGLDAEPPVWCEYCASFSKE
jgi:hypothetical protein